MALIKCPDCGREISDKAAECIGCGRPMISHENTYSNKSYGYQNINYQNNNQSSYQSGYQGNNQYNSYGTRYNSEYPNLDTPSGGLEFLSFLIPLLGLILFCAYNNRMPYRASRIGKAAVAGLIVGMILVVILSIDT